MTGLVTLAGTKILCSSSLDGQVGWWGGSLGAALRHTASPDRHQPTALPLSPLSICPFLPPSPSCWAKLHLALPFPLAAHPMLWLWQIIVWDAASGTLVRQWKAHKGPIDIFTFYEGALPMQACTPHSQVAHRDLRHRYRAPGERGLRPPCVCEREGTW